MARTVLRIGMLGASRVGKYALIAPVQDNAQTAITAIAARDPARAEAYAAQHDIPAFEADYERLIARDDVDVIYNALPPSEHLDWSITAMKHGKHVLGEKPFAMSAAQAGTMVQAAQDANRSLIEAFHYRFHPAFAALLAELERGTIGEIQHIEGVFTVPIPQRPGELRFAPELGGGALMDLGCYPVHWLRSVTGEEPRVVRAEARLFETGVDVAMDGDLAFPSGATGRVTCSMEADCPRHAALVIKGNEGSIEFDNPLAPHTGHEIRVKTDRGVQRIQREAKTTYHHQLDHLVAVLDGREQPLTGGADAVANMEVIDRLYEAAGVDRSQFR